MNKFTHSMTSLLNRWNNNYKEYFMSTLEYYNAKKIYSKHDTHKKNNTNNEMTRNKLATKQCPYYIGARENKIENIFGTIVSAIYCTGTIVMGCLYQFMADRKSFVPRSGRLMTVFINNNFF